MRARIRRSLGILFSLALTVAAAEGALSLLARALARTRGEAVTVSRTGAIFCVGDSNTEGAGAPAGRSYPDQLRERLARAGDPREVVNLGVSGFATGRILDKLEQALEGATPSAVLFLGGANDARRTELAPAANRLGSPSGGGRLLSTLRALRTFRVLEAGVRVVGGLPRPARYGGGSHLSPPDPESVPAAEWDRAYEEAAEAGGEWLFRWVVHFWIQEMPERAGEAFERWLRTEHGERVRRDLAFSPDAYRWDLAVLRGEASGKALDPRGRVGVDAAFAIFTWGYEALLAGRLGEARSIFDSLPQESADTWSRSYLRIHRSCVSLLERDFGRADRELREVLDSPAWLVGPFGLHAALGGSALAHLLRAEDTRLDSWLARYGESWKRQRGWPPFSPGQEWLVAAECVDAIKGGDAARLAEIREGARLRAGEPRTAPLAYLAREPALEFETLRREIPLEPPRISFFGAVRRFLPRPREEEFDLLVRPNFERLAALARAPGFRVVVLTYLDYEIGLPNESLRRLAREMGWALADAEALHGREELGAEGKRRYFSPNRHHPNEAGYALLSGVAFRALEGDQRAGRR